MFVLADEYVAGASHVALRGKITSIDYSLGRLTIGKQVVDFNAVLSDKTPAVTTGKTILVIGTQPSAHGVLQATQIR